MKYLILFFVTAIISLSSCMKDGSMTIKMNHKVGSDDLSLNQMSYTSPAGHTYEITKLRYYISEVTFLKEDASFSRFSGGHLIDLSDPNSLSFSIPNIEAGVYSQIKFHFGIYNSANKESYLESTLENLSMLWPAQLGPGAYHYMQYEGRYDSLNTGNINPYIFHAGPTMGNDNSFSVTLDIEEFKSNNSSYELNLIVDMNEWLQNPTVYDFKLYQNVMMNQNTQAIYKANGQSVFSAGNLIKTSE